MNLNNIVEIQQMNAENKLLVDVYIAQLEGYKAELTAELQNAKLKLDRFKAETITYKKSKGIENES